MQRDSKQSGLLKEQSEIDKVNEKYENLFKTISEFNKANSKNKIGQVIINSLSTAQQQQVSNLSAKEQAQAYKESIEAQKGYFDDFQNYQQEQLGDKAQEVYQAQLQGFKSYIDLLKAELEKLDGRSDIGSQLKKTFLTKEIADQQAKDRDENFKKAVESYKDLIQASETYNTKRSALDKKYNTLYASLALERGKLSDGEFADRLKKLQDSKKEELEVVAKNAIQETDVYKKFEKGFNNIGTTATKNIIASLVKLRAEMKDDAAAVVLLTELINQSKDALSLKTVEAFQNVASVIKGLFSDVSINVGANLKVELTKVADAINNVGTLFDKTASQGTKINSVVGLIVAGVNAVAKYSHRKDVDVFADQKKALEDLKLDTDFVNEAMARTQKQLENLYGMSKVAASFKYFDDVKKQADDAYKALKDFELKVITGFHVENRRGFLVADEAVFDFKTIDTSAFKNLEDYQNLLAQIKKDKNSFGGLEVPQQDIDRLQLLIDNYQQFKEAQEAFKKQLDETFTGTTASSITDAIVDGFRNGKRSIEDFAGTFEDLMRNAMLQSLKVQALEKPLQEFFNQFADASESDNILTSDETKKLQANYNSIITNAGQKFEQLNKILGLQTTSLNTQNSLKGSIQAQLTEQTGSVIAGQLGGLRLTAIEQLRVAGQHLNALNAIQSNTAYLIGMDRTLNEMKMNGIKIKP